MLVIDAAAAVRSLLQRVLGKDEFRLVSASEEARRGRVSPGNCVPTRSPWTSLCRTWTGGRCCRRSTVSSRVEKGRRPMPRILLVEDNEMNRDMLSRRLARREYEVLVAVDGKEGVVMAGSEPPDLILMDMSLPVMDGWEATRQLKASPETRLSRSSPLRPMQCRVTGRRPWSGLRRLRHKPIELPRFSTRWRLFWGTKAAP